MTNSSGQSLFEVLVALAIAALIVVGVASLSSLSVRTTTSSRDNSLATGHAQEAMEWLRTQRDLDWANIPTSGTYCLNAGVLQSGSCTIGIFTQSIVFSSPSAGTIEAQVTMTWTDGSGSHNVITTTRLTDWR